jgi:hypothetical protein
MRFFPLLLIPVVLVAGCSADGHACFAEREHSTAKGRSLLQVHHNSAASVGPLSDDVVLRPNQGGATDIIQFGVFLKGFYGVDFGSRTWTADFILTLRWTDPRVAQLVPQGESSLSLSEDEAKNSIWTPDIVLTNADFKGNKVVSTTFFVNYDGSVNKTQRVLATMTGNYSVSDYPYDRQQLPLYLASGSYMLEDLRLELINDSQVVGAADGLLNDSNWKLLGFNTEVYAEVDGSLRKSRGHFVLHVARGTEQFEQNVMLPEIALVFCAWMVFLLPVAPQFAMPRVTLSMVSFLSVLTINMRTLSQIPESRHGMAWIELFDGAVRYLIFTTVCFNMLIEATFHTWEDPVLAKKLTIELRLLFPVYSGLLISSCWFADASTLESICWMQRVGLAFYVVLHISLAIWRCKTKSAA